MKSSAGTLKRWDRSDRVRESTPTVDGGGKPCRQATTLPPPSSAVTKAYSVSCAYGIHYFRNEIMSRNVHPFLLGTDECSLIFKLKLMLKMNTFHVCISLHFWEAAEASSRNTNIPQEQLLLWYFWTSCLQKD